MSEMDEIKARLELMEGAVFAAAFVLRAWRLAHEFGADEACAGLDEAFRMARSPVMREGVKMFGTIVLQGDGTLDRLMALTSDFDAN